MWLIYCSCFQEKYWGLSRLTQLARRSIVVVVSQSYLIIRQYQEEEMACCRGGHPLLNKYVIWCPVVRKRRLITSPLWVCEESLHLGFLLVRYFLADAKLSQWDVILVAKSRSEKGMEKDRIRCLIAFGGKSGRSKTPNIGRVERGRFVRSDVFLEPTFLLASWRVRYFCCFFPVNLP